ncbi:hypothetical protein GCM10009689_11450 [Brevibacterium antiquum]|uniref:hypothetical protein n=1 Tax=Brevibacterium antiquum TaxID=234835 RepID=UPI0018DF979D|nr:hypothetical protein [Brevibacterium antiquum]
MKFTVSMEIARPRERVIQHDITSGQGIHFGREIVATGMWSAAHEQLSEGGPESTHWVGPSGQRHEHGSDHQRPGDGCHNPVVG